MAVSMWDGPYQLWQNPEQKQQSYFNTISYCRLTEIGFSFQLTCIHLSSTILPLKILSLWENKNRKNTQKYYIRFEKSLNYIKDELSLSLVAINWLVNAIWPMHLTDSHSITSGGSRPWVNRGGGEGGGVKAVLIYLACWPFSLQ